MELFTDLWLPMLVTAVLVFIVSSVLHMMLPIHKGDYRKLAHETELLAAMRTHGVTPGAYMFPSPSSMKDMASPEMIEKYQQGPVGLLTILPNGVPAMGKSLVLWLLYIGVISIFVGYLATMGLHHAAAAMLVFRFTTTAALMAYAVPFMHDTIWKGQGWITTLKFMLDGVIYSFVTGGVFTLLWPR
jgi:hypothetical protein